MVELIKYIYFVNILKWCVRKIYKLRIDDEGSSLSERVLAPGRSPSWKILEIKKRELQLRY